MPVILDAASAPALDVLLADVFSDGLDWEIRSDVMPRIAGIGTLNAAGPAEISFLANPQYVSQVAATRAAAVILSPAVADGLPADVPFARVVCAHPYLLYARVAQWFERRARPQPGAGVHASAVIEDGVELGEGVHVGAQAVVEAGAVLGDGCMIGPGSVVGAGSRIGAGTRLHARVTLYAGVRVGARCILHSGVVLGADGFGFAPDAMAAARGERGHWVKIPQLGSVQIGDDVEIGANTTIDRGALDDTVVGNGVILDNQIMIGHNVRIGDHTAMAGCTGVAGSTTIGTRCVIGGAAMIAGHIVLADDVHVSGGTVVSGSILEPGRYTAVYPMAEHTEWQRNAAVVHQLSRLRRRVQAIERQRD